MLVFSSPYVHVQDLIQISLFYELFNDEELTPTGEIYGQAISTHATTLVAK